MIACRHIIFAVRATVNCHGSVTAAAADDLFYPLLEYIRFSPLSFNRWYKIRHRDQDSPANPLSFSTAPLSGTASPRNVVPDSFFMSSCMSFFMPSFIVLFSIVRKNAEQMDFRGGGIRGIKAGVFFYYHSIIKRKQTQKQNESKHKSKAKKDTQKQSFKTEQKCFRRRKKWQTG